MDLLSIAIFFFLISGGVFFCVATWTLLDFIRFQKASKNSIALFSQKGGMTRAREN